MHNKKVRGPKRNHARKTQTPFVATQTLGLSRGKRSGESVFTNEKLFPAISHFIQFVWQTPYTISLREEQTLSSFSATKRIATPVCALARNDRAGYHDPFRHCEPVTDVTGVAIRFLYFFIGFFGCGLASAQNNKTERGRVSLLLCLSPQIARGEHGRGQGHDRRGLAA